MTSQKVEQIPRSEISAGVERQRAYFRAGHTRSVEFRLGQLQALRQAVFNYEAQIIAATQADLGRSEYEAYFEIINIAELNLVIKQLRSWMEPRPVPPSLGVLPASAWIQPEPLGVVLIMAPWNYPFQMILSPLIGAIAAGNCAVVKPSEQAPHTSRVVAELIRNTFYPDYVVAIEGDVETGQDLLAEKFDHIFFTGGTRVGKIVMAAAAQHLTPVTLELGGKNPCIVDKQVPIDLTARRIAWGKFLNAGQTCLAPDFICVDREITPQFLGALRQAVTDFFGADPYKSPDFARIINDRQFLRLQSLLDQDKIWLGGQTHREERYIAPTILDQITWDHPIMEEEIFGPILPVLEYEDLDEVIENINVRPKPLSLYLFSRNRQIQQRILHQTSSGGVGLNDMVLQIAAWHLPFGGVGESGIGAYHGKASFETFSHLKSVLKKPFWLDAIWRYAPYGARKLGLLKWMITLRI